MRLVEACEGLRMKQVETWGGGQWRPGNAASRDLGRRPVQTWE